MTLKYIYIIESQLYLTQCLNFVVMFNVMYYNINILKINKYSKQMKKNYLYIKNISITIKKEVKRYNE